MDKNTMILVPDTYDDDDSVDALWMEEQVTKQLRKTE
jgi:hypothetical protein